jgi:glyoxalase family protein
MEDKISGIHHVTAIAGEPQRNVDFYVGVLGLRLVKQTVNFDDPGTYHLYYGDNTGQPGTILTFFPWSGASRGRLGTGQIAAIAFSIPEGALGYWQQRLAQYGLTVDGPQRRFGEEYLAFADPDGMQLELVAGPAAGNGDPWEAGPVAAEHAIRGFYGVTLWEKELGRTGDLLTETLGFRGGEEDGAGRYRFETNSGSPAARLDLVHLPNEDYGWGGAGSVHHIAWRTPDDERQRTWQRAVAEAGLHVTPVMDRQYFRSIYFREPGGVLFEIATDPPGFLRDETAENLGSELRLPPWLERQRARIEGSLPRLEVPLNGTRG